FALHSRRPPGAALFPYTTLFRSRRGRPWGLLRDLCGILLRRFGSLVALTCSVSDESECIVTFNQNLGDSSGRAQGGGNSGGSNLDRKSTRLNSSHVSISYAVFCL